MVPIWVGNNHNQSLKGPDEICKGKRKGDPVKIAQRVGGEVEKTMDPERAIRRTILLCWTKLDTLTYIDVKYQPIHQLEFLRTH